MQGNRRRGPHGPGRIPEKPHDLKKALRDLLAYCRNDLRVIVISLILAAGGAVLTIIGPSQISKITDTVVSGLMTGIDLNAIARTGILLISMYACSALFTFLLPDQKSYTVSTFFSMLFADYFVGTAVGAAIHLLLIPPVVMALEKAKLSPLALEYR